MRAQQAIFSNISIGVGFKAFYGWDARRMAFRVMMCGGHASWQQPKITVIPHISAVTLRAESVMQIAEKIRAREGGEVIGGGGGNRARLLDFQPTRSRRNGLRLVQASRKLGIHAQRSAEVAHRP